MKHIIFIAIILVMTMSFISAQENTDNDKFSFTYHRADGNRVVAGTGTFPDVIVTDIELSGIPVWVVGYSTEETLIWFVSLENGEIDRIELGLDGVVITTELYPQRVLPHQPFVVGYSDDGDEYILPDDNSSLPYTHPVPVGDGMIIYIDANGDIILAADDEILHRLEINAMLDSRLVVNGEGQIAVYVEPTNQRYVHGIMGDRLEAAGLVILQITDNQLQIVSRIDLPNADVFEGLLPFWADIDGDGEQDLVTTISNGQMGAQIQVYSVDGEVLASGPAIGTGQRWRHQLAWGAFGPNGEFELVDILTPHIGGVVEFYRYESGRLNIVATQPGYTSHVIGWRNLDMAVAGDFNGDTQLDIIAPDQSRYQIAAIQHNEDGAQVLWELPVGGRVVTNLAAMTTTDNGLSLAAGTENGILRIWISQR